MTPARLALARVAALTGLCVLLQSVAAAAPPTREQALGQLTSKSAAARRAAVVRLADVGRETDTDAMVALLSDRDAETREAAEAALWKLWSRSGDPQIDALFRQGVGQMNAAEAESAVATFSEIIRRKPEFAEGWNKRATVLYFLGRFDESLKDCDEVIKRNPKHFGALSGYGQIHIKLENYDKALEYFERALAVNPNMAGVAANVIALRKLIADRARRAI